MSVERNGRDGLTIFFSSELFTWIIGLNIMKCNKFFEVNYNRYTFYITLNCLRFRPGFISLCLITLMSIYVVQNWLHGWRSDFSGRHAAFDSVKCCGFNSYTGHFVSSSNFCSESGSFCVHFMYLCEVPRYKRFIPYAGVGVIKKILIIIK